MTCTKFNTSTAVIGDTKQVGNVTYEYKGDGVWEAITAPITASQISKKDGNTVQDALDSVHTNAWGDRYVGTFAEGFIYTGSSDVGLGQDGKYYSPLSSTILPYTVGAVPDLGFVYQIRLNSLQALSGLAEPSDLDSVYYRKTTISEIQSGKFTILNTSYGTKFTVTDRAGATFAFTSGGVADGFSIINATNSDTMALSETGPIKPEYTGAIGDGVAFDTLAIAAADDIGDVYFSDRKEYRHTGLTIKNKWSGGGQLTYDGTGVGLSVNAHGSIDGLTIRPILTGVSTQVKFVGQSDMTVSRCNIRYGQYNIDMGGETTFGGTVINCPVIGNAAIDNIIGTQVKRSIISGNYILAAVGWGINFDALAATSPDQQHGMVIEMNHIFGNESGGIRYVGKDVSNKAQHVVINNNHIDHNYKDSDLTKPSYSLYIKDTERPLINGNLIRSASIMGCYLENCTVPVVTGNQFWKSTANTALSSVAIQAVNSDRGQFVGNGRDTGDIYIGLDDWSIVDRSVTTNDVLRARSDICIDKFKINYGTSGGGEGHCNINHYSAINNRIATWQNNGLSNFRFKVIGTIEATVGFTPFTGKHVFWSSDHIDEGFAVDLISVFEGVEQGLPQGEVSITKSKHSKVCAGIVEDCQPMSEIEGAGSGDGYFVMVAAVGDNTTDRLNGFRVNDSNGTIEAGDILVTSDVSGELMKMNEPLPESVVRFKAMSDPASGRCYGYFK